MTPDTPRADAASFSSRDPLQLLQTSQQLERELNASKAEVERLQSVLQNLTDAVTKRLSDDFQPEAARQLWEAFKVASETLDKR